MEPPLHRRRIGGRAAPYVVVTVELPDGDLRVERSAEVREGFYTTYRQLFERHVTDVAVEALSWRLAATAPSRISS